MSRIRDYRTHEQIVYENALIDRIAAKAGICRSRLVSNPIYSNPEEWSIDRRLVLDGQRVRIRWWRPSTLTSDKDIEHYAQDLREELRWRARRE